MWLLYRYQSLIFLLAAVVALCVYGADAGYLLSVLSFFLATVGIAMVVDQYIWRRTGSPFDRYRALCEIDDH